MNNTFELILQQILTNFNECHQIEKKERNELYLINVVCTPAIYLFYATTGRKTSIAVVGLFSSPTLSFNPPATVYFCNRLLFCKSNVLSDELKSLRKIASVRNDCARSY